MVISAKDWDRRQRHDERHDVTLTGTGSTLVKLAPTATMTMLHHQDGTSLCGP